MSLTHTAQNSHTKPGGFLKVSSGALARGLAGAGAAAIGAGLYGLLFGLILGLLHGDLGRVPLTAGFFMACGAIASALVGGLSRIIDATSAVERRGSAARRTIGLTRILRSRLDLSVASWWSSRRTQPGCWTGEPSRN